MKKLNLTLAILFGGLIYNTANAQVHVGIGLHFGVRPVYAPAPVVVEQAPVYQEPVYQDDTYYNDDDNDYYYLPDVEAYYSVNRHCYFYNDGGAWVSATYLPGAYRDYDWRNARRYEIHAYRPFMHNDVYRGRFGGFEGRRDWNHFDRAYAYRGYNGGFDRPHFDGDREMSHGYGGWNREQHFDNGNRNGWGNRQNIDRGNFNRGNFDRGNFNRGDFNRGHEDRGEHRGWGH